MTSHNAILPEPNEKHHKVILTGEWKMKKHVRFVYGKCDCGNMFWSNYRYLRTGSTQNCGCYRRENYTQKMSEELKNVILMNNVMKSPTLRKK